ncbi:hypothetical protein [Microcystis phage Mel-JY01]
MNKKYLPADPFIPGDKIWTKTLGFGVVEERVVNNTRTLQAKHELNGTEIFIPIDDNGYVVHTDEPNERVYFFAVRDTHSAMVSVTERHYIPLGYHRPQDEDDINDFIQSKDYNEYEMILKAALRRSNGWQAMEEVIIKEINSRIQNSINTMKKNNMIIHDANWMRLKDTVDEYVRVYDAIFVHSMTRGTVSNENEE